MNNHKRQIGICGTFDVENYGDLLFPLIAERELTRRLGPIYLQKFSYYNKTFPNWPYSVNSLTELPTMMQQLDGLLIGGGDLIRFDKEIAPGYFPPNPTIHHPTGYWLTPMLIAAQAGRPVIWNAPGLYGEIPAWATPLLKLAIRLSSHLTVRDEASRQALLRFAGDVEIKVTPDTVFGAAQLIDIEQQSAQYIHLCETAGLKAPYIIVQATTGLDAFVQLVKTHPRIFQDYQLVILPIGPALGDSHILLSDSLPKSVHLQSNDPLLLTEIIGHATAVIGSSLHLGIAALAFGVPVFRPGKIFAGKYAILSGFDTVSTFDYASEIDPDWFAAKLGKTEPLPEINEAIKQLASHWDQVASILVNKMESANRLEILGRFWQSIPRLMETWSTRTEAALIKNAAQVAKEKEMSTRHHELSTQHNAILAKHNEIITESDALITERDELLAERDALLIERHKMLMEHNKKHNEMEAERNTILAKLNEIRTKHHAILAERNAIYNSNSWKITAPLRALARKIKRQNTNNRGAK